MTILVLDFETFYDKDYSLSKKNVTTQSYIDDPRFEVIGVAVKEGIKDAVWCSGNHKEIARFLESFDWGKSAVVAHNALFDMSILAWKFGIYPKKIIDTLSMARAVHGSEVGNSLKKLASHYGLGVKGEEVIAAKGKRRLDFTKEELAQYGEYCKNDVELTSGLLRRLYPHFNTKELDLIDMTIRMHSEPVFELDHALLVRHLREVQERKEALLAECGINKDALMSNPKMAEVLKFLGVPVPMKTSLKTGKEAFAFAKTDTEFTALLEHPDDRVQAAVSARLGLRSTLEETRTQRFIKIAEDHVTLPIPLKYGDTLTLRFSGADSINLQNIPRGSVLKKAIIPPPGFVIVGADLSAVELRVGLWFAGQRDKVKLLAEGVDLYKDFASGAFCIPLSDIDSEKRFVGKVSHLSLIYGTGFKKLRNTILLQSGALKLDIGLDEAKRLTDLYRGEYLDVVAAWQDAGRALYAMRDDEFCTIGRGPLRLEVHGKKGILMPSGLYMRYPNIRTIIDKDDGKEKWVYDTNKGWRYIYGGKLFQNVVQGLARCVMGEAMVRINKFMPIKLTVHDSAFGLAPLDKAEEMRQQLILELRKSPEWAKDCPLDAEAGYGQDMSFNMSKL